MEATTVCEANLIRRTAWDYLVALEWQRERAGNVRLGGTEALALIEHPPVYTFGRRVRPEHLLVSTETLCARGAEVVETDRGGDITFHGPGQLVGYPIIELRRHALTPIDYVRGLEETLIRTLRRFDIDAQRWPGRPGVWVDGAKIGAIGVRAGGGVTTHGFALNVDVDLSWFDIIVPCGLADAPVTSMALVLGTPPTVDAVADAVAREFSDVFGMRLVASEPEMVPHAR